MLGAAVPTAVRCLDRVSARALGIVGDGAVLVRSDGVPVAAWPESAGATARPADAVGAASGRAAEPTAA